MKKEEKELLLQDLCARLPYGVMADCVGERIKIKYIDPYSGMIYISNYTTATKWETVEVIKPYLRPMSSMTEDEKIVLKLCNAFTEFRAMELKIDFLNTYHLDYRGLIPRGLALEAPDGMYNVK